MHTYSFIPFTLKRLILILLFGILAGCGGDEQTTAAAGAPQRFDFEFSTDTKGWEANFVDYPVGQEQAHELLSEWRALPAPLTGFGYLLSGHNQSDDLLMYLARQVTGLIPNARYGLTFSVEFASNAASGCVGIGGPPGEGVVIKAGANVMMPSRLIRNETGVDHYRLSWDVGIQSQSGQDGIVIGDIATSQTFCEGTEYELKTVENPVNSFTVFTDASGVLWFFVGADSGFEGATSLYITRIIVVAQPL